MPVLVAWLNMERITRRAKRQSRPVTRYREVEEGVFLHLSELRHRGRLVEFFCEIEMSAERLDAVASGADVTASETACWLDAHFSFFSGNDLDGLWWSVVAPGHSRVPYVACTRRVRFLGATDDWPGACFVAAWASLPEAINSLRQRGFTSASDFKARRPRLLGAPLRIRI